MYRQNESDRVLARAGARPMTQEEWDQVEGGIITNNCTVVRNTCHLDGDCPVPIRCP